MQKKCGANGMNDDDRLVFRREAADLLIEAGLRARWVQR
jgi:hypothetical protein